MKTRAIIVRSTSLGDFICMIPFINDLKDLYDEIIIFEISKSSSISNLLIENKKIKTIHFNSNNKISLFRDFIKNREDFYKTKRKNIVFFAGLSEFFFKKKTIYKIFLYKIFGFDLKFHPYNNPNLKYSSRVEKNLVQLGPLINVSKIPYLINNLKRKSNRNENLKFISLPKYKYFLTKKVIESIENKNLNIALFISAKESYKIWDQENWVKIIKSVNKNFKCNFFIIGGPTDLKASNFFCEKNKDIKNIFNLAGKLSPKGTMSFLQDCNLYIGNDASPMHMSAAVGLHCISIFSNFEKFGLWEPLISNSSVSHRPGIKFERNSKNYGINTVNYTFVLDDILCFLNNNHEKNKHIIKEHYPKNIISTISIQNGFYDF